MKNIFFIINPQAKNGYCQKVWIQLEKILIEQKISYMAFFTEYSGHAKEISHNVAAKAEGKSVTIIAVGGDGTLHEVLNGVISFRNVQLAFIPCGSGNDFSRGFGIPKKPSHALLSLLKGLEGHNAILVDTGKILTKDRREIFFINNMGAGFDALISRKVNRSSMKRLLNRFSLGKFVYVYFLLKNMFTYKPDTIDIKIDGKDYTFDSAWFVTVSNQPYYGGGMKISPDASPFDGLLNITVVHNLSRIKLLFVFMTVFWGGHTRFKEVSALTGRSVKINSACPLYVHADGEDIGNIPVEVAACRHALPVIVDNFLKEEEVNMKDGY